jgi:hypothetical protein
MLRKRARETSRAGRRRPRLDVTLRDVPAAVLVLRQLDA